MKIVTYNIQFSLGKDGRLDLARIVDAVKDADIVGLQEVDRFTPHGGMVDQPAEIAAMLPDRYWLYAPSADLDLSERGADGRVLNRRRQHGVMLLSRWPLLSKRVHLLPHMATTTHINHQCVVLESVVRIGERALRVNVTHLSHLSQPERLAQVAALLDLHRRVWLEGPTIGRGPLWKDHEVGELQPMPFDAVYLGDFNFDPRDREYGEMVGPLDHSYGRIGYRDRLVDAWVAGGNAWDEGSSFPPNEIYPEAEGWRLDYVFVTPDLGPRVGRAWIDGEAQGSDHQPMWAELDL